MKEIVNRLTENRQVEIAKSILEDAGYKVTKGKKLKESDYMEFASDREAWEYEKEHPELSLDVHPSDQRSTRAYIRNSGSRVKESPSPAMEFSKAYDNALANKYKSNYWSLCNKVSKIAKALLQNVDWSIVDLRSATGDLNSKEFVEDFFSSPLAKVNSKSRQFAWECLLVNPDGRVLSVGNTGISPVPEKILSKVREKLLSGEYKGSDIVR